MGLSAHSTQSRVPGEHTSTETAGGEPRLDCAKAVCDVRRQCHGGLLTVRCPRGQVSLGALGVGGQGGNGAKSQGPGKHLAPRPGATRDRPAGVALPFLRHLPLPAPPTRTFLPRGGHGTPPWTAHCHVLRSAGAASSAPKWRQPRTRKSMNAGISTQSISQGRPSHQWSATGCPGVRSLPAKHHTTC